MRSRVKQITNAEFTALLNAQGLPTEQLTFKCPMCATLQNINDLIAAGAGTTPEEAGKYLGFSCIGRFTGAPSPRKQPDGQPCDWTLGGFLRLHRLEVLHEGKVHPYFDIASPEEARAHVAKRAHAAA